MPDRPRTDETESLVTAGDPQQSLERCGESSVRTTRSLRTMQLPVRHADALGLRSTDSPLSIHYRGGPVFCFACSAVDQELCAQCVPAANWASPTHSPSDQLKRIFPPRHDNTKAAKDLRDTPQPNVRQPQGGRLGEPRFRRVRTDCLPSGGFETRCSSRPSRSSWCDAAGRHRRPDRASRSETTRPKF